MRCSTKASGDKIKEMLHKESVTFSPDATIEEVLYGGWHVPLDRLNIGNPRYETLYSILVELNSVHLCNGVPQLETELAHPHHLPLWDCKEKKVATKTFYRPKTCCIIGIAT
ncbi:uncharacterized protein LOC113475357 [Ciona intestinalis]